MGLRRSVQYLSGHPTVIEDFILRRRRVHIVE